ncbi:MAG: SDR family oxidoreductase [Rickettsiales bacterium]
MHTLPIGLKVIMQQSTANQIGARMVPQRCVFAAEKAGLHLSTSAFNIHRSIARLIAQLNHNHSRTKSDAIAASELLQNSKLTTTQQGNIEAGLQLPVSAEGGILLTGATGFLGVRVLQQLMKQDATVIYCLVRAASKDAAHKRLLKCLANIGVA